MSDSPPRRAAGNRKPAAVPARRRIALRVAPDEGQEPSLLRKLRSEARTGVPGLLASLALHGLILSVMAWIIIGRPGPPGPPALDGAWLVPQPERPSRVTAGPVQLESFRPDPAAERRVDPPPPPAVSTAPEPRHAPVRPADVKQILDGRRQRQEILARHGGDKRTERAIEQGLAWLARQQQTSGNWRLHEGYPDAAVRHLRTDTGATALALLAFLGAGHTHDAGPHQETVRNGLAWLKGMQQPDGNFHDDEGEIGRQSAFYAHSQAAIVLCEAYALSGDEALRDSARRGVQFLLDVQRQSAGGGWKYSPIHDKGDLSVSGWALMALHTARAAGIEVPEEAFVEASLFIDSVQERGGARYKYEPTDPPGRVTPAMTAEGLLCRQFLGWPADHPPLLDGIGWLTDTAQRPQWSAGRRNVYAWYYTAQVLHNVGGEVWTGWYADALAAIVPNQVTRGGTDVRGSWHPTSPPGDPFEYADKAGRLYITAMCLLILETPFRHLSIYDLDAAR